MFGASRWLEPELSDTAASAATRTAPNAPARVSLFIGSPLLAGAHRCRRVLGGMKAGRLLHLATRTSPRMHVRPKLAREDESDLPVRHAAHRVQMRKRLILLARAASWSRPSSIVVVLSVPRSSDAPARSQLTRATVGSPIGVGDDADRGGRRRRRHLGRRRRASAARQGRPAHAGSRRRAAARRRRAVRRRRRRWRRLGRRRGRVHPRLRSTHAAAGRGHCHRPRRERARGRCRRGVGLQPARRNGHPRRRSHPSRRPADPRRPRPRRRRDRAWVRLGRERRRGQRQPHRSAQPPRRRADRRRRSAGACRVGRRRRRLGRPRRGRGRSADTARADRPRGRQGRRRPDRRTRRGPLGHRRRRRHLGDRQRRCVADRDPAWRRHPRGPGDGSDRRPTLAGR